MDGAIHEKLFSESISSLTGPLRKIALIPIVDFDTIK